MTFTNRSFYFLGTAAWGLFAVSAIAVLVAWRIIPMPRRLPEASNNNGAATTEAPAEAPRCELSTLGWHVFETVAQSRSLAQGKLAARFRLAGTFLEYGTGASEQRKAILDDMQTRVQSLVSEGNVFDGILVARVLSDRVVLRQGESEETLWLTFSGGARTGSAAETAGTGESSGEASGSDRFGGRRIGDNRWIFERDALMRYYRELMDNPERLIKVFDSLEPVYTPENTISGYQLRIEGEPEFFDAVGFRQGDFVRAVNSVDMTNRRRAEFFIRQFVEGKANAFVIELERGGESLKQVYQVR